MTVFLRIRSWAESFLSQPEAGRTSSRAERPHHARGRRLQGQEAREEPYEEEGEQRGRQRGPELGRHGLRHGVHDVAREHRRDVRDREDQRQRRVDHHERDEHQREDDGLGDVAARLPDLLCDSPGALEAYEAPPDKRHGGEEAAPEVTARPLPGPEALEDDAEGVLAEEEEQYGADAEAADDLGDDAAGEQHLHERAPDDVGDGGERHDAESDEQLGPLAERLYPEDGRDEPGRPVADGGHG